MSNPSELQAIISIIDTHYGKIRMIEVEHDILGVDGDFRTRIEYYHDAVRVLSAGDDNPYSKYDRLAPERIAHDVAILRQIQDKPLVAGRGESGLSPHSGVAASGGRSKRSPRPDRSIRQELSKLYQDYTVLFVALLAQKVEDTAQIRSEEADMLSQECQQMQNILAQLDNGEISADEVLQAAESLEHDDLHALITGLLQSGKPKSKQIKALIAKLQQMVGMLQDESKKVEDAGHNFSTSQLAVYEEARDTVQRLATQGLNIAGKFVESSIARSQGQGQGRGQGF